MRKKYEHRRSGRAIEAGQSPAHPLFRETRAQRKAREDAEKERKRIYPTCSASVEEGDPHAIPPAARSTGSRGSDRVLPHRVTR